MTVLSILSRSEDETERVGAALGAALRPPAWVGLRGPMGAGKTRLAAGVVRGLGYGGRVRSPTFVLENRYRARVPVRHLDLYRLDAVDPEIEESWETDGRSIVLVEWAERAGSIPDRALTVDLTPAGESERWIVIRFRAGGGVVGDLDWPRGASRAPREGG